MAVERRQQRAMTSGGLIKTSFQMRSDQLTAVDAIAQEEGVSRAAIVSRLIDIGLKFTTVKSSGAVA